MNTILWYFPRGEIILGVLEMPCTPQKQEGAAARTTQLAQKLEKTLKTQKNRMLALSHSLPPFFLTRHERNMGEIGRSMKKLEICRKKSMLKIIIEHHFAGIPKGIYYFF